LNGAGLQKKHEQNRRDRGAGVKQMSGEHPNTSEVRSTDPSHESARFFNRMEPLILDEGQTYAEVCVGKRLITVGDADFTVNDALKLRAWLNSVLPL
jgi:hypothetical protein